MNKKVSRRDFLKVTGLLPISIALPEFAMRGNVLSANEKRQNVLIIVFDAFSAHNISLHGYQRKTTPNIARWAERAITYHNHYAGGNYTTPGTASLLTGVLPWKHRAFTFGDTVDPSLVNKNIFAAFKNHYRFIYSHNPIINVFAKQFRRSLEDWIPSETLFLKNVLDIPGLFDSDEDIASVSWVRTIKNEDVGYVYSLFLSHLYNLYHDKGIRSAKSNYPRGIPRHSTDNYFLLEDAIDWLGDYLNILPQPFMGYFHLLPPHAPYATHRDFYHKFSNDSLRMVRKPADPHFGVREFSVEFVAKKRTAYDEFILYVDREFGRLMERLEGSGVLENTWVILTSDHGELFERGVIGHKTPLLYQSVIRIPLIIFEPGRKSRNDIHISTSAVDVLPTMLHVTGQPVADWSEGQILPPFSSTSQSSERNVYAMEARNNERFKPVSKASLTWVKENFKLIYYFGYGEINGDERVELYDIERDPEELNDLQNVKRDTVDQLLHELKIKLEEAEEPFKENL